MEEKEQTGELFCVNHPKSATRVRCSSCESPICVKCMNDAAVGIKCPSCARVDVNPLTRKRQTKAGLTGLLTAAVLGAVLLKAVPWTLVSWLPAGVTGFVVGLVVKKTGTRSGKLAALATVFGLTLGRLFIGLPLGTQLQLPILLATAIAAAAAGITASR